MNYYQYIATLNAINVTQIVNGSQTDLFFACVALSSSNHHYPTSNHVCLTFRFYCIMHSALLQKDSNLEQKHTRQWPNHSMRLQMHIRWAAEATQSETYQATANAYYATSTAFHKTSKSLQTAAETDLATAESIQATAKAFRAPRKQGCPYRKYRQNCAPR